MDAKSDILVKKEGRLITITLNRPQKKNSFTPQVMYEALKGACYCMLGMEKPEEKTTVLF